MPTREGPEGDETQVNISGLPADYRESMWTVSNTLPGQRRGRLRRAYTEAVVGLLDELDRNPRLRLHGSVKGGVRLVVWLPSDVVERLDAYCENRAFKNGFFVTAVHRYLEGKGVVRNGW